MKRISDPVRKNRSRPTRSRFLALRQRIRSGRPRRRRTASTRNSERGDRAEAEDQHGVERDVQRILRERDRERRAHVLQAAQRAESRHADQDRRAAEQPDLQVDRGRGSDLDVVAHEVHRDFEAEKTDQREPAADRSAQKHRESGRIAAARPRAGSVRVGDFGLGADPEEVERPEDARERRGADSETRERYGSEPRDERGVCEPRERLCDQRNQHRK